MYELERPKCTVDCMYVSVFLRLREETHPPFPFLSMYRKSSPHILSHSSKWNYAKRQKVNTKQLVFNYCFSPLLISEKPLIEMPPAKATEESKMLWLLDLCKHHVENYVVRSDMASLSEKTDELSKAFQQQFECRFDGCQRTFVLHSRRVR